MDKETISLGFETERLDALNYYLQKEKTSPQKELGKMMEELYEKAVPADVREERKASPPKPKVKPPAKPKTEAHAERADTED